VKERECPTCEKRGMMSTYTEYGFCTDCFKRLKRMFIAIIIHGLVEGIEYLTDIATKEKED